MIGSVRSRLPTSVGPSSSATPLELFFDLVFVFAFTQVTGLMTTDPTWAGIGHAVLVLAVLWWTWAGYPRLTNRVDPEEGFVRILIVGAMGSLVVMTFALPQEADCPTPSADRRVLRRPPFPQRTKRKEGTPWAHATRALATPGIARRS